MKQFDFSNIEHKITLAAKGVKMHPDDKYPMDKWRCTIRGEVFDYFTGLGLRKDNQSAAPDIKAVLHSLFLDADYGEMTHSDFCSELGYNPDSLKDMNIWLECQKTAVKIRKMFSTEEREWIREALQDY